MSKLSGQHDSWFKLVMSHLDIAAAFLKAYLPRSIVKRIDWRNLQLFKFNPESMLGKLIGTRTADMVYTTKLDGHPGYLICHSEHQSTLNEETYLRAEIYSRLIYLEHRKMHPRQPKPAIVSIVYFHGKENTAKYPTCLEDLMPPKPFDKYFLKPLFINVHDYSDEELEKHGQMAPADLLFKYSIKHKPSRKIINKLFKNLSRYPFHLRADSLYYMSNQFDIDWDVLSNEATKYFEEGEVMTAAEQLKEKGQEIEKHNIALNALKKGSDPIFVSEITGLSLKVIKSLKKEVDKS